MLAGEAIGAGALGAVRQAATWTGPWGWGVRPGHGARIDARGAAMRPVGNEGSKVR